MSAYIGLHDSDATAFPNLALMKLSAWHKARGDRVEPFLPLNAALYDVVYSSKVFTFTPESPYLPPQTVMGGTGYDVSSALPTEIEGIRPDYSLYPGCDYAVGFLTRGCIRACPWCVVPRKEGAIRACSTVEEIARHDTRNIVFMDNNVLAHEHGLREIERLAEMPYRVDFNQGLDARIIAADEGVARLLARLKWYRPLRLACDRAEQIPHVRRAVELLRKHGAKPSRFFCYVLVQDIEDALQRVMFLRSINVNAFAQPYRDFENAAHPTDEQRQFSWWCNRHLYHNLTWTEYRVIKGWAA